MLKKIDADQALKKKLSNMGTHEDVVYNDDGTRTTWAGEPVGGVNFENAHIKKNKNKK